MQADLYIFCLYIIKAFVEWWDQVIHCRCKYSRYCIYPKYLDVVTLVKMSRPLLIVSQSDSLILIVDINSHSEWQTVQIQISWLLQKPTDLDLHCLQRQGISGFSRTKFKTYYTKDKICTNPFYFRLTCLNTAAWVANSVDPDQMPSSVLSA